MAHVRVVHRHVGQLALEQADELVRERVALVVGVGLEGQPEHGHARFASEPRRRLTPSTRNSGTDSFTRETASSIPGAAERSSEKAKSLRRHVPAVKPGRAMPPRG